MSNVSIRLPDELLRQLDDEAGRSARKRSELIRDAVVIYLRQCEQDRFLAEMVEEAKVAYGNDAMLRDALDIAADFDAIGSDLADSNLAGPDLIDADLADADVIGTNLVDNVDPDDRRPR